MIFNDVLPYSQISALSSDHQKDFIWKQMRTDVETHSWVLSKERDSKLKVLTKFLPSELRESCRGGCKMIVRFRGYGGHQANKVF